MKQVNILNEIQKNAIIFGNEANRIRAFASVYDGLKTSQRCSLWEMYVRKYFSNKPPVKSLKIDGGVTGNWHPHGSVYLTFARLSQPFIMNLPLVDFHGGNGSQVGGDDCAASRYTEAKLSTAAEKGYFTNIDKDTCNMIDNYLEDAKWPEVFPAIIPNLFINGSDGIGYGFAQSWQPGNLREFSQKVKDYLNGTFNYDNIYPDFPTRGEIVNKSDIKNIYMTGTGSVILRGKAEIDGDSIKITELPYQVYVEDFINTVKYLSRPNEKGICKIEDIDEIYNLSDKTGMLIEIECLPGKANTVLNQLYRYSNLQVSIDTNMNAVADGIPEMFNLEKYIKLYTDRNIEVIQKELTYDLNKVNERLEIVSGLFRATSDIDNIITCIKKSKSSDDARSALMKNYGFTEAQAKAIVDMKLGKLAGLEIKELKAEEKKLKDTASHCKSILKNKKTLGAEFVRRLDEFTAEFGWDRRTKLSDIKLDIDVEPTSKSSSLNILPVKKFGIILTEDGLLKKMKIGEYKLKKSEKELLCANNDYVLAITVNGNAYRIHNKDIPISATRSNGTAVYGENVVAILEDKCMNELFMITHNNYAKKLASGMLKISKKNEAVPVINLEDGDYIVSAEILDADKTYKFNIVNTKKNETDVIEIDTSTYIAKGRGAKPTVAFKLKKNWKLV